MSQANLIDLLKGCFGVLFKKNFSELKVTKYTYV